MDYIKNYYTLKAIFFIKTLILTNHSDGKKNNK